MTRNRRTPWLGIALLAVAVSIALAQSYGPGRFSIVHLYSGSNNTCTAYDSDRLFGDKDCDGTKDATNWRGTEFTPVAA